MRMLTILLLTISLAGWMAASQAGEQDAVMPDIPNKTQPDDKTLIGGQPEQDQLHQARDAGIRTVVNLRGVGEFEDWPEAEVVTGLGMSYVHIPIGSPEDLNRQTLEAFDQAVRMTQGQPTLFHCASGNRVGAMFALRAGFLDGKGAEEALAIGRAHGLTSLEDHVRGLLESGDLPNGE